MKKQLFHTAIAVSLLFPFYSYAEESSSTVPSTQTKELKQEKGNKNHKEDTKETKESHENLEEDNKTTDAPLVKNFTTCSQEAIEVRDTGLAASRSMYNIVMTNALTERKNKEKSAIAIDDEDDKKAAIKLSVDTYKAQAKAAQNTLTQARKNAWATFEADIKKCRELQDEETSGKEMTTQKDERRSEKNKEDEPEAKTIKNTIKAGIESFKSLFN